MINMTSLKNKFRAYSRLIRIHTVIATAITPVLGACATFAVLKGELIPYDKIPVLANLFLIGILVHIIGEILNDYIDYDIDKKNTELSKKPLVSGDISKKGALMGIFICFIALIIILSFSRYSLLSILVLLAAALSGIIYQLISKKWLHSAIFLAAWDFLIILFGGIYAGRYSNLIEVPVLVYIISILGFFQVWINTAILGHLKDIKNDSECGVKTFPMSFGVRVKGEGKIPKLIIPINFRVFVLMVQIVNLVVVFIPIVFYKMFYNDNVNIFLLFFGLIVVSVVVMRSMIKIMWHRYFERNILMRMMAVREIGSFFLSVIILSPLIGWLLALFFVLLPLVWFLFANLIFSGNPLQPAI